MNEQWRIVVASSNLEARRSLGAALSAEGLEPICASGVAECRAALQAGDVGLIFCDSDLKDGSYVDILRLARRGESKARVVVTSGSPDWDEYLRAIRFGAFDVMSLPSRPIDLKWIVTQARRDDRAQNYGPNVQSRMTA